MSVSDDEVNAQAFEMICDDQEMVVDMKHRYSDVLHALKDDEDVEFYILLTENIVASLTHINLNLNRLISAYKVHKADIKKENTRDRIN